MRNCSRAVAALSASGDVSVCARSRFYRTEPVDYTAQSWFVNAVVAVETNVAPLALIERLKAIETDAGRIKSPIRFGPRILDLDILLYDRLIMDSTALILPHPRMHKRRFVLKPICDIAANLVHPVLKKNMRQLLDGLADDEQKVVLFSCD